MNQLRVKSRLPALKALAIGAGVSCAILFPILELAFGLHLYGDGSIFSYGVAVRDTWNIHWHNIPVRSFVYLYAIAPAETLVALSGNAQAGIALYALLLSSAQLAGLAITYFADRSERRTIFAFACASTAILCPLVAGFPTEMWVAHAAYWPLLTLAIYAPATMTGFAAVTLASFAVVFSHEGGIVMSLAIAALLAACGRRVLLWRFILALALAMSCWLAVKFLVVPEEYVGKVMSRAALNLLNPDLILRPVIVALLAALSFYALVLFLLRRFSGNADSNTFALFVCAAFAAACVGLAIYWLIFDRSLHSEGRYFLRTLLIVATPALGTCAGMLALGPAKQSGRLAFAGRLMKFGQKSTAATALAGAFALVLVVHAFETVKFTRAWKQYVREVGALASASASDPRFGDSRFVSAQRLSQHTKGLAWASTTPYLSILLSANQRPAKLVIDPDTRFFWMSCERARAQRQTGSALPLPSLEMIERYACLADRSWPSIGLTTQASRAGN